jgi:anti-sigma B factor antagonist
MQISTKDVGDVKVVQFQGTIDTNTSEEAKTHIDELLTQGARKILVDFSELEFLSSVGLRVLLGATKDLKAVGGGLRVCNLNETVQDIFDMSGFSTIIGVFKNESDALNDF